MNKQINLEKLCLKLEFDSTKVLDSNRRTQIVNMYEKDSTVRKLDNRLLVHTSLGNNIFRTNNCEISEPNIEELMGKIEKIEKIFNINVNESSKNLSLSVAYKIEDLENGFDIEAQLECIQNLIGNKELLVSNLEIFDSLEDDISIFIKISIQKEYLYIKTTTQIERIEKIEEIVDHISKYIKTDLRDKLFEEGRKINGTEN